MTVIRGGEQGITVMTIYVGVIGQRRLWREYSKERARRQLYKGYCLLQHHSHYCQNRQRL
jgi:hypothetical protein